LNPEFYNIPNDLLVKYLLHETTDAENAQVKDWLAANTEHQKQYEDLKIIWEESRKLAAHSSIDENEAWLKFKDSVQQKPFQKPIVRPLVHFGWMRIAALFIIVAGAALLSYFLLQPGGVQTIAIQTTAQTRIDTLPDGSVVTLNKNSQLSYPDRFTGDSRTIALQGEAFFNVAPDKSKPFIIQVNDVTVKVVGTSFNIRSERGTTEVIVETGEVQVIRHNKIAELHSRERITVKPQDTIMVKAPVQEQLYNYYRTKEFVCDNTPLWKLVEVLNEAYDTHIVIEKASLRNLPLTTTFYNEPLDHILNIISQTLDIEVIKREEKIILQ
jgi:ferric-dicitrate binding protein FerR (iron transport regulator)